MSPPSLRESSVRRCRSTRVLSVVLALAGATALAAEPDIGQRLKVGLVPPVLVAGEAATLTSLPARMQALRVPAVSIAVIRKGELVWAGGFGAGREGAPVTADTLFQAGSISKPLTAMAAMMLVQSRELDLDAGIDQYLKSWKLPPSPLTEGNPVTLRRLLSHSAGITVSGFGGHEAGRPLPSLIQVLDGEPPATNPRVRVDISPGTRWRYSGGGYVIIQQLLMDVTQRAFPQLMREDVLVPFGMKQSTFQQPLAPELLARVATPYAADGTPLKGGPRVYPEMAPAGLWTTPSDLARFVIGIQRALDGRSQLLSRVAARTMLSPVPGLQNPLTRGLEPGLGWILGGKPGHRYFQHHGGNAGYLGYVVAYESGDGAAIMINTSSGDGSSLIDDIVRTIADTYGWPDFVPAQRTLAPIAPENMDQYAGAYRSDSGELLVFWRDQGHVSARIWGQPASEIFPTSSREYFSRTTDRTWTFTEAGGSVTGAVLHQQGDARSFAKLDDREGRDAVRFSIELESRIRNQTPAPGGERALLESIAGVMNGNPDYDRMAPGLADVTRRELSGLQRILRNYGQAKSVSFKRVRPDGLDVYEVVFETGPRDMEILFAPDGRIHTLMFNR